ncbi:MAG: hypothetical protein CFH01_00604 [Alphaproteobacteria bacterium MarineAlpha2_Bin1]|nr:MAG: hypothetical protein CFH01_00604 [Alphaproteobacteria bacterium MarineAlpha2_Bin1]|tara:strand:+ start:136 stop:336 length:201 start_codon:yes stop_codon:yes gene_type:complete
MVDVNDQDEAKLIYYSGRFDIIIPGFYVRCAVTNKKILIENLRYWDPDIQEAYFSAEVCFDRYDKK